MSQLLDQSLRNWLEEHFAALRRSAPALLALSVVGLFSPLDVRLSSSCKCCQAGLVG
jgi:hypothetical protein